MPSHIINTAVHCSTQWWFIVKGISQNGPITGRTAGLYQQPRQICSAILPGQPLDIKGSLECKWVAWCHCQIISSCTHMSSTHSAPLYESNTGQMSGPQYQLFQLWISLASNSGKTWGSASAQIRVIFSQDLCVTATLLPFIVGYSDNERGQKAFSVQGLDVR